MTKRPHIPDTPKDLRKFGIMMAIILTVISLITLWRGHMAATYVLWAIAGVVFLLPALLLPSSLRPIFGVWMKFAFALGWFNSRVILSLTFFLLFTPISLVQKIIGRDPMDRKFPDPTKSTYWHDRSREQTDPKHFQRQF
ncbi:sxtJ [bacterium]|nr:sxtJ [bacterium]